MPVRFAFLTDTHHYPDAPVASKLMARAVVLGGAAMMLVRGPLRQRGASAASEVVVADYLRLPDQHRSGRGMTAGGSLSPLLAAVMLISAG